MYIVSCHEGSSLIIKHFLVHLLGLQCGADLKKRSPRMILTVKYSVCSRECILSCSLPQVLSTGAAESTENRAWVRSLRCGGGLDVPAWWAWELAEPSLFSCMLHTAFQGVSARGRAYTAGSQVSVLRESSSAREQHDAS